jgi:hypothetical protein
MQESIRTQARLRHSIDGNDIFRRMITMRVVAMVCFYVGVHHTCNALAIWLDFSLGLETCKQLDNRLFIGGMGQLYGPRIFGSLEIFCDRLQQASNRWNLLGTQYWTVERGHDHETMSTSAPSVAVQI